MAFSMTGYGKCVVRNPLGEQQWEIRSVNSRFLDLKWRLPKNVKHFEYELEKVARRHMVRGRVEIFLEISLDEKFAPKLSLDYPAVNSMLDELLAFSGKRDDRLVIDYSLFLSLPDLWKEEENPKTLQILKYLEDGLGMALADWNQSRLSEGDALVSDLLHRVERMNKWLGQIREKAPVSKEEKLDRLRKRIAELLADYEADPARTNQELVIMADKLDVTEELTRLGVHLKRLEELLQESGADLGKRLDFTLQECFREINTCGNKAQGAQISAIIVDFKNELEKCREQAMNLE